MDFELVVFILIVAGPVLLEFAIWEILSKRAAAAKKRGELVALSGKRKSNVTIER